MLKSIRRGDIVNQFLNLFLRFPTAVTEILPPFFMNRPMITSYRFPDRLPGTACSSLFQPLESRGGTGKNKAKKRKAPAKKCKAPAKILKRDLGKRGGDGLFLSLEQMFHCTWLLFRQIVKSGVRLQRYPD